MLTVAAPIPVDILFYLSYYFYTENTDEGLPPPRAPSQVQQCTPPQQEPWNEAKQCTCTLAI